MAHSFTNYGPSMSIPPTPPPPDGVEHIDVKPTTWVVTVVFKGDRYGLDGCLVNDGPTLVTFDGHDGTMYGCYRADTLLPDGDDHFGTAPPPRGLYVDHGQRVGLDAGQYAAALNFITRTILDQPHDEAVDQVNTDWCQTTPSEGAFPQLIEAMRDMLDQFQDNEQYDEADAEVIARAREAYAAATGGA